jgi:VanZ family protein
MSAKSQQRDRASWLTVLTNQGPLIAYAALIFLASSMSKLAPPDIGIAFIDKIAHGFEYGLFFLLALRAVNRPPAGFSHGAAYVLAFVLTVVYGALDEFHQSFVPGRDADVLDLVADTSGAILAAVGYFLFHRSMNRRPDATIGQDVADAQK